MFGLTLVGDARPVELDDVSRLPSDYVALVQSWGPGTLLSNVELPDPTEAGGQFSLLQARFRVQAPVERNAGRWVHLGDDEIARGVVLGVDARGNALLGLGPTSVWWLLDDGTIASFRGLTDLVERLRASDPLMPAVHVTEPSRRPAFFAALDAGDDAAADAALVRVLEIEHPVDAPLALAYELATARDAIDPERRASYVDQLLRMAKRKAGERMKAIDMRAIRATVAAGELPPALRAPLEALVVAVGMFAGRGDRVELALLAEAAAHPGDGTARAVLADHLDDLGDAARAEAMRAPSAIPSLPDAAERGLLPLPNARPVANKIRDYVATWARDSPAMDVAPLVAALDALHPQERTGYAMLLDACTGFIADETRAIYEGHLTREIEKSWPLLVLALRSTERKYACEVLVAAREKSAAPYLLDAIRHATSPHDINRIDLAAAFARLEVRLDPAEVAEFLPWLSLDAGVEAVKIAARLLVRSAGDDRVFEAYLANFCDAHPFSVNALTKRRREPRVVEVLRAQFAHEEAGALKGGRILAYSRSYGLLSAYLKKLGVPGMAEAHERFRKNSRMNDAELNPRGSIYDL